MKRSAADVQAFEAVVGEVVIDDAPDAWPPAALLKDLSCGFDGLIGPAQSGVQRRIGGHERSTRVVFHGVQQTPLGEAAPPGPEPPARHPNLKDQQRTL